MTNPTFRIIGHYVDPYTWKLVPLDTTVQIDSCESAKEWARQSFFKCQVNIVRKVEQEPKS